MSYASWFQAHGEKHRHIVSGLTAQGLSAKEIIEYFDFENMVKREPEFCTLYAQKKKCHDMEKLNCYLCACPHFRFNDDPKPDYEGKSRYSSCSIDAKEGNTVEHANALHHDCSGCTLPHHRSYIEKHFDFEWFNVMRECDTTV